MVSYTRYKSLEMKDITEGFERNKKNRLSECEERGRLGVLNPAVHAQSQLLYATCASFVVVKDEIDQGGGDGRLNRKRGKRGGLACAEQKESERNYCERFLRRGERNEDAVLYG